MTSTSERKKYVNGKEVVDESSSYSRFTLT